MRYNVATQWNAVNSTLLLGVALSPREIGQRIAQARDRKGWSQVALARHANVSPSTISRWERGLLPPIRELQRLAEILEVEAEWLVEPVDHDLEITDRLDRMDGQLSGMQGTLARIAAALQIEPEPEEEGPPEATRSAD